jgi:hypothetical protein
MKNTLNTIMSVLILIVLAAGVYFIVQTVRESAKEATAPFEQVNQANYTLQTQLAQAMNPTPTIIPDPVTYISNVRALARLETIRYSAEQVVTCEITNPLDPTGFLASDRLLFIGHGEVIAGIDMEKIQPGDMFLQGSTVVVKLPPAELFVVTLNNEKSHVYDRDTGVFAANNINLETECRRAAEEKIRTAVLEDGILQQAQNNAENYFYRFFTEQLGYDKVQFIR